jgi:hypothetical protein
MGYKIEYTANNEIVKIIIDGRVNFNTARKYSKEAIEFSLDYNCVKFLFDHSKTKLTEGIRRIYTDGDILEQFGFQPKDKIAILIECEKDDPLLRETNSINAKWSNFRYFNSGKKALEWLIE